MSYQTKPCSSSLKIDHIRKQLLKHRMVSSSAVENKNYLQTVKDFDCAQPDIF